MIVISTCMAQQRQNPFGLLIATASEAVALRTLSPSRLSRSSSRGCRPRSAALRGQRGASPRGDAQPQRERATSAPVEGAALATAAEERRGWPPALGVSAQGVFDALTSGPTKRAALWLRARSAATADALAKLTRSLKLRSLRLALRRERLLAAAPTLISRRLDA